MFSKKQAFTITEVMVVIVIIGVLAAAGIPQYVKKVRRTHERTAIVQLMSVHAANELYRAATGDYLATGSGDLAQINSGLNLSITPQDFTYAYLKPGVDLFQATAQWTGSDSYTVRVNQDNLDYIPSNPSAATNPCCSAGTCPILPAC